MQLTDKDFKKMQNNGTKSYVGIGDEILSSLCRAYEIAGELKQNSGQSQKFYHKMIIKRMNELTGNDNLFDGDVFCFHRTNEPETFSGIKCADCDGWFCY